MKPLCDNKNISVVEEAKRWICFGSNGDDDTQGPFTWHADP